MKVAILVADGVAANGGIERVMSYMTREFEAKYADLDFKIIRTRLKGYGVLSHLTTLAFLVSFLSLCVVWRPDVLHVNVAPKGSTWRKMLFVNIARRFGVKIVLHLHGSGYDVFYGRQAEGLKGVIRAFFRRADKVVVLGSYWRDFVITTLEIDGSAVAEIDNGVPDPKAVTTPAGGPPLLVFSGAVSHRKGVDVLIEALAQEPAVARDWRMVLLGGGDLEAFGAQAARLGVANRVDFKNWVTEADVNHWLLQADIFVLPSRAENQPVAILEAMARGVPVVSTTIGAIPEQVLQGETGILVPPDNAVALSNALSTLIAAPDLRAQMGRLGREHFLRKYSSSVAARKFVELYYEVAGRTFALPDAA